ncbi:Rieske (2Fe-2S) protein [Streptomyces sp. NPDC002851]
MGAALAGTAVAGAALAGCGAENQGEPDEPNETDETDPTGNTRGTASPGDGELALTSAIPVGGGKVFKAEKVVVTQPDEGTFKGFSAVCTHRGCTVANVSGGTINCVCHGSKFNVDDGSVARGPATRPLPGRELEVDGDSISLA